MATKDEIREEMIYQAKEYLNEVGIVDAISEHIFDCVYLHWVDTDVEAKKLFGIANILGYVSGWGEARMDDNDHAGKWWVKFDWSVE